MSKTMFALCLVALVGCSSTPDSGDDGGVDGGVDSLPPFTTGVSTLSGSADDGYADGIRGKARFHNPVNVAYGPDGVLYVADFDNDKLRTVDVATGFTSTLINQPTFRRPFGLLFAPNGTLYVSTDNDMVGDHYPNSGAVWRIDFATKKAILVANKLGRPRSMAWLHDGRIAIADYQFHVIELLDPSTGAMSLLAGTWGQKGMVDARGPAARFATPYGLVQRADGKLVVADFENNRIRVVGLDGAVATLGGSATAGFVDGAMTEAQFNHPQGLVMDGSGDLYVTDLGNYRIRRIHGDTIETIAGSGEAGWADNDDPLAAKLHGLEGLSVKPDGSYVYFADGTRGELTPHNYVRMVQLHDN